MDLAAQIKRLEDSAAAVRENPMMRHMADLHRQGREF